MARRNSGRSSRRRTTTILSRRGTGTLTYRDKELPVRFALRVDRSGDVSFTFTRLLLKNCVWILDVLEPEGRFFTPWKLRGATSEGHRIECDHVYVHERRIGSNARGSFVDLGASASHLRIHYQNLPKTTSGVQVEYRTVGLRGFHMQTGSSRIGDIKLAGPTDPKSDEIAGFVTVTATKKRSLPSWLRSADDAIERLLTVVALAEGAPLPWSIRRVFVRGKLAEAEFYGRKTTWKSHDGAGHFLDLQPWVDLGLVKYTKALQRRTGLDVAINWFLFYPSHLELQLLAASVALEHLVAVYSKHAKPATILHKRTFAALRRDVAKVFAAAGRKARGANRQETVRGLNRLAEKFVHTNEGSFRDRLNAMLRGYRVPVAGMETAIGKAFGARNVVVHTGLYEDYSRFRELHRHVVVLRELLKRIFFTLLGFTGQYHSMLNGAQWVAFPPKEPTIVADA